MVDESTLSDSSHRKRMDSKRAGLAARVAWLVIVVVIASGVVGALHRALNDKPDWEDLARESRQVWESGRSLPGTAMFGYLPTTTFALWPFTAWTPRSVGIGFFVTSNLLAALASVWILYRWWWRDGHVPAIFFAWPVLLACANLQHALQANQITLWTLVLCLAGLTLVGRQRAFLGGVVLGLAGLIKVLPFMLVGYLLLRGKWRALGGVLVAVVLFDAVPSVAFFGWQGAIDEHRAWLQRVRWHSSGNLIDEPLLRVHRHGNNASYAAVLTRWLRSVPDARRQVILYGNPPEDVVQRYRAALAPDEILTLDPMPRPGSRWAEKRVDIGWVPRFHIANLGPRTVWWIWSSTLGGALVALVWFTWRTGRGGRRAWDAVGALWMLAMFFPSPMTRHYYLAWALPAIAVVTRALWSEGRIEAASRGFGRSLALAALLAWVVGVLCLGWHAARWYGIHLGVLILLIAATVWACRRASVGRAADPLARRTGAPEAEITGIESECPPRAARRDPRS
ncbi:MAG: DUF2029 domain-containing protein [Planctomycetes bacterium]|nr:DUF2029 domain-containing protein [Planctomycetota bacterium]